MVFLFAIVLALLCMVSLVNGLVKRHLRKLQGGRESALFYHTLKKRIMPLWYWGSLLYVVLPFYVAPDLFLLPLAIASVVALSATVSLFKKYL